MNTSIILGKSLTLALFFLHEYFDTNLIENLWRDVWLGVEEVQHVARVLDAVFGRLFWRREAVVPGAVEVFETGGAILQVIALARYDGLLLGNTAWREDYNLKKTAFSLRSQERHQERLEL